VAVHSTPCYTFYGGAAKIYEGDAKGSYESTIPDSWKEVWSGTTMACGASSPSSPPVRSPALPNSVAGNVFNSGKAAMGLTQTWYTCCLGDFRDAGNEFQLGIQPMGADGEVHGRVDADTFRIWKGTPTPKGSL
jgi:hypothetical protein